jgi:C4-dicarboxylate-specific signal transduction histidine kinase
VLLQTFLILGLLANRSKRRKAQAQLLEERESRARSEKMASIGMLAAGIAHEINQPLNAIKLLSSGLVFGYKQGKEREKAEMIETLEEISRQTSRVADIIDHLRALIQRDDHVLKPCDINAAVNRALELVGQQLAAHGIVVETQLGHGLPAVTGVPTALEEVVINLLVNSMQALDTLDKDDKRIEIRTGYHRGVVLEVSDNGPGVNSELGTKIFEPFVSTKATAETLGLGLTIVNNIITMYGGTIRHEASEGDGAKFIIRFPDRE